MNFPILKNWWLVGLKGIFTILFGILALIYPQDTILILTLYFGILTLTGGILVSIFAFQNIGKENWRWFLFEGIIDLLFGIAIILNPSLTVYVFTILIGVWMIFGGIFRIWFALRNRDLLPTFGMSLTNGIVTLILGIAITFFPISGIITLSLLIGLTAIFFGLLLFSTALRLRKMNKALKSQD